MTTAAPDDHLPPELLALVSLLTSSLGPAGEKIAVQAEHATYDVWSPTMLDVLVPVDVPPVPLPDGPAPVRALVVDDERPVGEVLLWIRSGWLIGLEQAWWTDAPPDRWPDPHEVQVS